MLKAEKIEALIEQASFKEEREETLLAKTRILSSLDEKDIILKDEKFTICTVTIDNPWKKLLFVTLCRKYGLSPYRYKRQRSTTTNVEVSKEVMKKKLWPEYQKFVKILDNLVEDIIEDLLKQIWQGEDVETVVPEKIDN